VADHQGRAVARRHQGVGVLGVDDRQSIGTLHAGEPLADRLAQFHSPLQILLEEMAQDLAVGLREEGVALADQLIAQEGEIFDDAVVDDRDPPAAVAVRMGVDRIGLAMSRPAGVADPQPAGRMIFRQDALELGDLAGRLAHPDSLPGPECDARAVVTAVFQPVQPVEQQRQCIPVADIAHYPAHWRPPFPLGFLLFPLPRAPPASAARTSAVPSLIPTRWCWAVLN